MKTAKIPRRGAFQPLNKCVDGENIEVKIRRIVDEKEPITDGAPIIFTDAKDGVRPEFNPRTDRWEIAIDAMDKVSNYQLSKYTQCRLDSQSFEPNPQKEVRKMIII